MTKLTNKQQRFIDEYLIDLNATQAAIRAGYSKKYARSAGAETYAKPDVKAAIAVKQEKLQNKTAITQEKILTELAKIGFANITDYLEYKTALRVVGYKDDGEPEYDWAMLVNAKDSTLVDGSPVQEVSISKDGTFKFKLYNKMEALEKLGRHLGLFDNVVGAYGDTTQNNMRIKSIADLLMAPVPNRTPDRGDVSD